MNCPKCKKIISEGGKFCESCGTKTEQNVNEEQVKKPSGLQTAALVMGILGFFIPFITSVLAIIFGAITIKEKPNGKAVAGLVLGIVTLLMIPILASMILVSLSSAREKAKDAMIKSTLSSERVNAEIYFSEKGSYKGYDLRTESIANIKSNNTNQETPELKINDSGSAFAMIVTLSDGTKWCVDSTGYSAISTEIDSKANCVK